MGLVTIQWESGSQIEAELGNCSAQGVRAIIQSELVPETIPQPNDTILAKMLHTRVWLTGRCIYASGEEDGSLSIGIFFPNPYEQNHIQHLLYEALRSN